MKVKHAYHLQKFADAVYQKISKLKLQLTKVGAFFETQCIIAICSTLLWLHFNVISGRDRCSSPLQQQWTSN